MDKEPKDHLWIPDEEVQRINKKLMAIPTERNVVFEEHGSKLSKDLQNVKKIFEETSVDSSLLDADMVVFNVVLPEGEKIQDKNELFNANGMHVRAVKNVRSAIVTSSHTQFQTLKRRVESYMGTGNLRTYFDFVESFNAFIGSEKDSNELRRILTLEKPPVQLDVQLMLIPNLEEETYLPVLKKLINKIKETDGSIQESPYYLSDKTPVVRAIIPSSTLQRYENDPAIYRIEQTDFFDVHHKKDLNYDLENLVIDESVNIENLPIVTILDSGVSFPVNLQPLILRHWTAPNSSGGDNDHGTKVASCVAFRHISSQASPYSVVPRTRIIDCNVLDGKVPVNVFIQRIQAAVNEFYDISKIYNLSANSSSPIEGDEMSIIGYELDALQLRKKVQFIISSGNHTLWQTEFSLQDILDDEDSRISAPADSMLSITVGSVVGADHVNSLSSQNDIAPYSRRGPGFRGLSKPDLTAFAGTIISVPGGAVVPEDEYSLILSKQGNLMADAGTSFSAPIVAGDYAEVLNILPDKDILLAKALLFHNAVPFWDYESMDDNELSFAHNLYGRGISNVDDSKYSSSSKVTFVRTGTLNRTTKERLKIYMPEILAAQLGRNVAKVSVTCVSMPPVDRTKGTEYLGGYIRASLKKSHPDGVTLRQVNPNFKEGRQKWDVCHQFTKMFSRFNAGDWQVWLELFSRWDDKNDDIPYALVVTIEDVSGTLDIYSEIEALNRYRSLNSLRVRLDGLG